MSFQFFRKYNKIIMAVGGSLLMIIFLLPSLPDLIGPSRGDIEIGMVAGEPVLMSDREMADSEINLLARIHEALRPNPYNPFSLPGGQDADLEWLLLVKEAEQHGLWASQAACEQMLADWGVSQQTMADVRRQSRANQAFIYQALRHYMMVFQLKRMLLNDTLPSEPELRRHARDTYTNLKVRLIEVPAERFISQAADPDNALVREKFDRHKAQAPGDSEPYGFGYLLPPRIKLEYIYLSHEAAKQKVTVTEVEANRYYDQNKGEFVTKPTVEGEDPETIAAADALTIQKSYREVRDEIKDKLHTVKAHQLQQNILNTMTAVFNDETRRWPRSDDAGYIDVPKDPAQWPGLERAAQQAQAEHGLLPEIVRQGDDWTDLLAMDGNRTGLGAGLVRVGDRVLSAAQYLATCRELIGKPYPTRVQVGMICEALIDTSSNVFLVRIIEARPAGAPVSISQVQGRIVDDLRRLDVYRALSKPDNARIAKALEVAKADGLDKAAESIGDDVTVFDLGAFSRRDRGVKPLELSAPVLPVIGESKQFVDAAFAAAAPIIEAGKLEDIAPENRFAVIPVDKKLSVYIIEFTEYQPMTAELFAMLRPKIARDLANRDLARAILPDPDRLDEKGKAILEDPLTFEAIARRIGFTGAREMQDLEEQEDGDKPDENTQANVE